MNEQYFKDKKLVNIILNCRERIDLTQKLIHSIETKTKNLHLINLTILIDFDDQELINFFTKYGNETNIDFKLIIRQRTHELCKGGINLCYKISDPAYFYWVLNNDTHIITDNWDEILYNRTKNVLKEFNGDKKFVYVHIDDDTHVPHHHLVKGNSFPICSTTIGEVFNGCVPEEILHWTYDTRVYGIISWVKRHPDIGSNVSILDLIEDIKIQHTTYYIKTKAGQTAINTDKKREDKRVKDDIDERVRHFTNDLGLFAESGYTEKKYYDRFMKNMNRCNHCGKIL